MGTLLPFFYFFVLFQIDLTIGNKVLNFKSSLFGRWKKPILSVQGRVADPDGTHLEKPEPTHKKKLDLYQR